MTDYPWPRATVTGLGSLPGTEPLESTRTVFGELPLLPHVVELPARGAGADMIGRSACLLADLPVQIEPSGWRFAARAGIDLRRARDYLAWDLEALEDIGHAATGAVKVQVTGPLTLAASIELVNGQRAVADPGAVREIAESLAAGVEQHLIDVAKRLPQATIVLQVDEPALPAVIAAEIPTPSGYGTLRAVSAEIVEQRLATVLAVAAAGSRVVHCCAATAPIGLFVAAGADAVAIDVALLDSTALDAIGAALDTGMSPWLGVVPTTGALPTAAQVAGRVQRIWDRLAFDPALIPQRVVLTPACGLAGVTAERARQTMEVLRLAASRLDEQ